jgi:hypothetical protein
VTVTSGSEERIASIFGVEVSRDRDVRLYRRRTANGMDRDGRKVKEMRRWPRGPEDATPN